MLDTNNHTVGQPVEVNSVGEFAIAGLSKSNVRVRATSQNASVEQTIQSSALFSGRPVQPINLILPNRRPQIKNIFAKVRGQALRAAKYGQTVNISVAVEDPDHDQLKIVCRGQDGAGNVVPSGINKWTWKLPQVGGSKTVFILASDNRGGFATANLSLAVGSKTEAAPAGVRLMRSNDLLLNAPGPNPIPTPGSEFLTLKRRGDPELAKKYYEGVDPDHERLTLGAWWAKNGFDNHGDAQGAVRTSYLNNNDLGSGRDMHVLRHDDGTVSAYVTNYGGFDQDQHNADLAANQTNPGATVCMEYSPIEHQDNTRRVVKFFVYLGGTENAPRQIDAKLDNNAPKYVPNVCLNCHGGNYRIAPAATPTLDDLDMSASFREFDLETFKYPGGRETPNQTEQDAFKRQNLLIKGSDKPESDSDNSYHITQPAIKNLINGWYANDSPTQIASFVPVGWSGDSARLYSEVVAKSCRTCHVALETDPRTKGLSWISFEEFLHRRDDIINAVCGDIIMPHANITFTNFWRSDRPATFASFSTTGWDAVGQCPQ